MHSKYAFVGIFGLAAIAILPPRLASAFSGFPFRPDAAAITSESTRQPAYNDFLRLIFANINPPPTMLGGPNAYEVFFGATAFYEPPITVARIANFSGIPVNSSVDLFVLRCIPSESSYADPNFSRMASINPKNKERLRGSSASAQNS
jgi:hypothetical protein